MTDLHDSIAQFLADWAESTATPSQGADAFIAALPDTVVPLVWVEKNEWHHIAENPFGECWIKHYAGQLTGKSVWNLYGPGHYGHGNTFPTIEAAKAAAQAHYVATSLAAFGINLEKD